MLNSITQKITGVIGSLTGKRLSEKNIEEAIRTIRIALIESDVNIQVIKKFIGRVKEKSLGNKIIKGIDPYKMFIKIIHDELSDFLGGEQVKINLKEPTQLSHVLLMGLQGSGKTTTCGKLAKILKKSRDVMTVSLDIHRPSANEQLKLVSEEAGIFFYDRENESNIKKIIKQAFKHAKKNAYNLILWDTAGRTHVDLELMKELKDIMKWIDVDESLLVCDSMLGQQAATIAKEFKEKVDISGLIFTKFDSETKGGAVLSVKEIVNSPIKYIGVGEKIDDLDYFDSKRIADRMLGMGDVVGFVEKAQSIVDEKEAVEFEEKIRKQEFDLQDYYKQLKQMFKMGSIQGMLSMIPGMGSKMGNAEIDEKNFYKLMYIIESMTIKEKQKPFIINNSRKSRIAKGSGTTIVEVSKLLKQFKQMKQMMKKMKNPAQMKKMLQSMGAENIDFSSLENKISGKL